MARINPEWVSAAFRVSPDNRFDDYYAQLPGWVPRLTWDHVYLASDTDETEWQARSQQAVATYSEDVHIASYLRYVPYSNLPPYLWKILRKRNDVTWFTTPDENGVVRSREPDVAIFPLREVGEKALAEAWLTWGRQQAGWL